MIDGLPVLGISLIIASIVGVNYPSSKVALVQGIILGLSLWTHSEAILFIPLTLAMLFTQFAFRDFKSYLKHACTVLICCIAVAAPPYLQNLKIFGAIVSDNPQVFAIPELAWGEYFRIARGIENWGELIQYGLFKGWFAIEAYSITFWIMLIAMIGFYWNFRENLQSKNKWLFPLIVYVLLYLMGTLLSIIVGIDLLIKNERYWLVLMPPVALISGWGLGSFMEYYKNHRDFKKKFGILLTVGIVFLFISQWFVLSHYKLKVNGSFSTILKRDLDDILSERPEFSVVRYLKNNVPRNATVFSLVPANMYYSSQKMISYLDPVLINFYKTKDKMEGWKLLKKLGIDYIHVPNYYLPPMYNSVLQLILADPRLTTLIYNADSNQIYKLNTRSDLHDRTKLVVNFTPGAFPWHKTYSLIVGGRKNLASIFTSDAIFDNEVNNDYKNHFHFFQRDWSTTLEPGNPSRKNGTPFMFPVIGNDEYLIQLDLFGHALVTILMEQYDNRHQPIKGHLERSQFKQTLGEFVLGDEHPNLQFMRRFKIEPEASYVRFYIIHKGSSFLIVKKAELIHLKSN